MEGGIVTDIRMSSMAGIPFGNNAGRPSNPLTGQPYFNGESQRLEVYAGSQYGWQNIVSETPGVIGYIGNIYELTGGTIDINGTNFASGAVATLVGTDGTEYVATSTSVNNLTSITAVFGPISGAKEPYDIRVTNPSNLYGVYYDILTVNDSPIWQTSSGSLSTLNEGSSLSVSVSATDEENNTISYSSSNLPAWISLNSSSGQLTGTAPSVSSDTTYSFSITASDGNNSVSRNFSITVNSIITWNTLSGNIDTIYDTFRSGYTYALSATALGNTLSYSIISGTLPSGLSLNSSTGLISGNADSVASDTTSTFTVRASDGTIHSDRSFNIIVKPLSNISLSESGNWIAPVTGTITFTMMGAGGGGSAGNQQWATGAGGGGYLVASYSVVKGQSYSYSVGSAGVGQTVCDNSYWSVLGKGGDSQFATMIAGGGYGGDSHGDGVGANAAQGGTNSTTGAVSVLKNYSGGNGGVASDNNNNFGGHNGLRNSEGSTLYGSGAAGVPNGSPGTHATGNGNGGAGGPSCQGGAHRGGGNGSAGFITFSI